MSQNVYDWDFSRECLQFSLSVTVLDKVAKCFRARTQMFLWSSVIFFFDQLQLVTQICVFPSFSDRN